MAIHAVADSQAEEAPLWLCEGAVRPAPSPSRPGGPSLAL